MTTEPPIVFLYNTYLSELEKVRQNRKQITKLQEQNRKHQENLELTRQNMVGILKGLITQEGSLYKVYQKYFGAIDKHYYRICSLTSKHL